MAVDLRIMRWKGKLFAQMVMMMVEMMVDLSLTYPLHQLFKVDKDLLDRNYLLLPWKTEAINGKFRD